MSNETKRLTYRKITKAQAVKLAKQHQAQDRLIKGTYYRNGSPDWKGCSIGCDVKISEGGEAHRAKR